jgi:DNA-binding NarL/FixJ family response regulator
MRFDPLPAIEACYAPASDRAAWLGGVLAALAPLDDGYGVYAAPLPDAADGFSVAFGAVVGEREEALGDVLVLFARDDDGSGLAIAIPLRPGRSAAPRLRRQLASVAAHLLAAWRLRAALDALAVGAESTLSGAVRRAAPPVAGDAAAALWRAFVEGEWTIVERAQVGGRRLILAHRVGPGSRDPKALSPRERDVLAGAATGRANKEVAWRLGVSPSTVATHLRAAMRKLQLPTRRAVVETFAASRELPPERGAP